MNYFNIFLLNFIYNFLKFSLKLKIRIVDLVQCPAPLKQMMREKFRPGILLFVRSQNHLNTLSFTGNDKKQMPSFLVSKTNLQGAFDLLEAIFDNMIKQMKSRGSGVLNFRLFFLIHHQALKFELNKRVNEGNTHLAQKPHLWHR